MAKFRYSHLFTKKTGSAAITAAASELNNAEIALAIAKGEEKILFKNVSGDVVTVPTDEQVDEKISNKTDYEILGSNGRALVFNEADGGGAKFEHNDGTWSFVGVNDGGQSSIAGQIYAVKKNAQDKYEGAKIDITLGGMYYTVGDAPATARTIPANEIAVKGDIPTIPSLEGYFDGVNYVKNDKKIYFYHGETQKAYVDTTDFVIDGMIESVEIKDVTSGASTVKCLVIVWNTDAGKEEVDIPLSEIFNPDNYYTKAEVDTAISAATSGKADASDVETISGNVNTISGNVNTISGNVNTISGDVATVSGDVATLSGTVQTLDEEKQDVLTAGQCIEIDANNVIYFDANKTGETSVEITLTAGEF